MNYSTGATDAGYADAKEQQAASMFWPHYVPMMMGAEGSCAVGDPGSTYFHHGNEFTCTELGTGSSNGSPEASFGPYTPLTAYSPTAYSPTAYSPTAYSPISQAIEQANTQAIGNDPNIGAAFAHYNSWNASGVRQGQHSEVFHSVHEAQLLPQDGSLPHGMPLVRSDGAIGVRGSVMPGNTNVYGSCNQYEELARPNEPATTCGRPFCRCQNGHIDPVPVFRRLPPVAGNTTGQAHSVAANMFPGNEAGLPLMHQERREIRCAGNEAFINCSSLARLRTAYSPPVFCVHPHRLSHIESSPLANVAGPTPSRATESFPQRRTISQDSSEQARALNVRKSKDDFLIQCKRAGMSYKEIRAKGRFMEAESTLRGRYRTLTKEKHERLRRPQWEVRDISLLRQAVKYYSPQTKHSGGGGRQCRQNADSARISWKKVAKWIADHGGSYHFGNATCKKKWESLQK